MYKTRTLGKKIDRLSKAFKIIMLTGMRQVGKTTLMRMRGLLFTILMCKPIWKGICVSFQESGTN